MENENVQGTGESIFRLWPLKEAEKKEKKNLCLSM